MILPEGTLSIVANAQKGDELAIMELFSIVKTYHMKRYVGGYYGRNVLVSRDEIESEFLLGVWKALPGAKLDVGNPINYMCFRGQKKVQTLFKKEIHKGIRYQCLECGFTGSIGWRSKVPSCIECYSSDLHTWMVENADVTDCDVSQINLATGVSAETAWQLAVYGIQIEELRERLSGRALDLFDIIVLEGICRDSSKNYLREIADRWGSSTTNVAAALRRVRREVEIYISEEEG